VTNLLPNIKAVSLIFLLVLLLIYRSKSVAILLVAAIVGITVVGFRQAALNNQLIQSKIGSSVSVEGVIHSDPVFKSGKVNGSFRSNSQYSCLFKVTRIDGAGIDLPLRLKFDTKNKLQIDQMVSMKVMVVKTKERKVAALVIASGEITIIKQPKRLFQLTSEIRKDFRNLAPKTSAGALIPGLVIGDTSLQSEVFTEQMRRVGLSHLTAVSGANFALVASFLFWLLQFVVKNLKHRLQLVFLILLLFIFLVRPTPSVLRAAVMTAVVLLAKFFGNKSLGIPSLAAAITLLILLDPLQSIDPGFVLSVLATAGILLLSPVIEQKLARYVSTEWIAQGISIPVSATVFCLPIIVLISGQLSLVTVPANILVAPVIAPITVLGFISAMFSPFSTAVAQLLFAIATPFASWIVFVSNLMADVPIISFNQSGVFLCLFLLALIAVIKKRPQITVLILILFIGQVIFSAQMWPGKGWQVVNCDVGQGDALVINLGSANAILVDVGPEPIKIDRCLRRLGIKSIPLLILTHFHADHVGGVSAVLKNRKVGQVWISNLSEPAGSYKSTMAQLTGLNVKVVNQGEKYLLPDFGAQIFVVWPASSLDAMPVLPGDGSAANNSSVSVIIKTNKFSLFAGGDIEPAAQEAITNSGYLKKVDYLKVSHHGSAYQYLPMLDQLMPKVAIISVGINNSYGHPSGQFIDQMQRRGIQVWRTDHSGGISLATPNKIRVTGKEWWQIRWG